MRFFLDAFWMEAELYITGVSMFPGKLWINFFLTNVQFFEMKITLHSYILGNRLLLSDPDRARCRFWRR
jgi:hypothetical protein